MLTLMGCVGPISWPRSPRADSLKQEKRPHSLRKCANCLAVSDLALIMHLRH